LLAHDAGHVAWLCLLRSCHEYLSRLARPDGPSPAYKIGDGQQGFPHVSVAILNSLRHERPVDDLGPQSRPTFDLTAYLRAKCCVLPAPIRFNALAGVSPPHTDDYAAA
jgi:hypothetical protein